MCHPSTSHHRTITRMAWNHKQRQDSLARATIAAEGTIAHQATKIGPLTFVQRCVPRTTFVLSLVTFLACVGMWVWIGILDFTHQPGQGLPDIGAAILLLTLCIFGLIASSVGCILALIGLGYLAVACREFSRSLAILLALNVLAGPVPLLCIWIARLP